MNHLYEASRLKLAITGYFHDTFNFDADYFYDGHQIIWVADFIEQTEEHLFMNILPNDVISTISNFYRKKDFFDMNKTDSLFKITGESNQYLLFDHKNDLNHLRHEEPVWRHAFGTDVISKYCKKIWKLKLSQNIEQIAIGIIGFFEQEKLINEIESSNVKHSDLYSINRQKKQYSFLQKEFDGIGIESCWDPNAVDDGDGDERDWEYYKKSRDKTYGTQYKEWTKKEQYCDYLKTDDIIEFIVDLSTVNDYKLRYIINDKECDTVESTMLNCDLNKKYKLCVAVKNVYNTDKPTQIELLQ